MLDVQKTRQEYIHELAAVQDKVYQMGLKAENAVRQAMQALVTEDRALAAKVMKEDDVIDDMIIDVEDDCILLIAKQQPIAHDLRVIATGFKISTDIERIGDHAFDVARVIAKADDKIMDGERAALLKELGDCAAQMVEMAMQAYREGNIRLADDVRHMDAKMDDIFKRTFYSLSQFINSKSMHPETATSLLFIARFLERIGDHAVNIAEWVIYLETAERIHTKKTRYAKD